jgi:hypothetical protein
MEEIETEPALEYMSEQSQNCRQRSCRRDGWRKDYPQTDSAVRNSWQIYRASGKKLAWEHNRPRSLTRVEEEDYDDDDSDKSRYIQGVDAISIQK